MGCWLPLYHTIIWSVHPRASGSERNSMKMCTCGVYVCTKGVRTPVYEIGPS